ncbi:MAG: lipopolysaccharide biosynthesis protein [Acidobacteriota bacterium]|nr:lipopolysaccharide biosynthesis protein [Acidobacteriota bacterium]
MNEALQRSQKRYRGIAAAALSAFFGKGIGLLVNAATVPITVRYLGAESYGLWITISSAVAMFFVLDIGISSTLTNLISEAYAKNDRERAAAYFATAFWVIVGIAACFAVAGWLAWPYLHWASIFHVKEPALALATSRTMAAAFIVFLVALPTGLITKVLAGYQELHTANFFAAGGSILSLLVVVAVVYLRGSLPLLVAGYAGASVVANIACLLWMCLFSKPWMKPWPARIHPGFIGQIFHSGIQFFGIQVAGFVVFSSDNLVISHYLSPAQVTPYSVTWRLVGYIAAIQTLIFPALWPAYSEAYTSGHLDWIRSTYRHVRRVTAAMLTIGCVVMILFGQSMIRLWAGPEAVPGELLIWLMCVWIVIYAVTTNQSCLMGATSRIKSQAIASLLGAAANLALSIFWVKTMGVTGVLAGTIVAYLTFIVVPQVFEVRNILRGR